MALPALRVLSLCSGVGGLDLGVKLAVPAARVVCHVERDSYAASVLVARMAEASMDPAPIWSDLATFDGQHWRGVVDLVVAGFPCQPASTAGQRQGTNDDRWLWPLVARIIRDCAPSLVFLENVPGLLTVGGAPDCYAPGWALDTTDEVGAGEFVRGGAFAAVLADLAALGFDAEWLCVPASAVGAPHRRERVFVLAHADRRGIRDEGPRPATRATRSSSSSTRKQRLRTDALTGSGDVADTRLLGRDQGQRRDGDTRRQRLAADSDDAVANPARSSDAGGRLRHEEREDVRGVGVGGVMGDASRDGGREGRSERTGREREPAPVGADGAEGHAIGTGLEGREVQRGDSGAKRAAVVGAGRDDVADTKCRRRSAREPLVSGESQPNVAGRGAFPPGPDDRTAWERILTTRPDLAPATESELRRLDDGLATGLDQDQRRGDTWSDRADRLRCAGNGVVRQQAALAFRVLAERAGLT